MSTSAKLASSPASLWQSQSCGGAGQRPSGRIDTKGGLGPLHIPEGVHSFGLNPFFLVGFSLCCITIQSSSWTTKALPYSSYTYTAIGGQGVERERAGVPFGRSWAAAHPLPSTGNSSKRSLTVPVLKGLIAPLIIQPRSHCEPVSGLQHRVRTG